MLLSTANLRNKLFKEFPNFRFPRNCCITSQGLLTLSGGMDSFSTADLVPMYVSGGWDGERDRI